MKLNNLTGLQDLPSLIGIYFLLDQAGDVVYVGQSRNVLQRVNSHTVKFHKAKYIPIDRPEILNIAETQCIRKFKPIQNAPIRKDLPIRCRHCRKEIPDGKVDILGFCDAVCQNEYTPGIEQEPISYCRYCGILLTDSIRRFCKPMCRKMYWLENKKSNSK
jgi:hypothetical protein